MMPNIRPANAVILLTLALVLSVVIVPSAGQGDGSLETELGIDPGQVEITPGSSTTVDIVVKSGQAGVGAYDVNLLLMNQSVAEVTDVDFYGDPAVIEDPETDGDIQLRAAGTSFGETGSINIASITIRGKSAGVTTVLLFAQTVSNENHESYTITASNDATVTVGGDISTTPIPTTPTATPSPAPNEAPTIDATVEGDQLSDGSYTAPVSVDLSASDSDGRVERIEYRVDDGPFQQVSASRTSVKLTQDGTHTVEFRAVDTDGAESALKQTAVTVSPDRVQLNLTASETKLAEEDPLRFTVTRASDGDAVAGSTISVAGETVETDAAGDVQYTFSEPGTYTVTASKDRTSDTEYVSDSIEITVVGAAGNTELAGVWATFQGDYSRAGYRPRGTAPQENATVAWSQFAQAGETSPVVADGTVYASRGDDLAAFAADSGDVVWDYQFDGNLGAAPIVVDNKRTDETDAYIVTTEGALHAINASNGERRWKKPLTAPGRSSGEIKNEFAIVNNIAYVPVDDPQPDAQDADNLDALVAVNLRTQTVLWTYEAEHIGGVADVDERLYVAAGEDEMLLKFDAGETRAKYWSYKTLTESGLARGEKVLGAPSIRDGTVYIRDETDRIHAVDADGSYPNGDPVWTASVPARADPTTPDNPASMAVTDKRVIVSNDGDRLVALDQATGEREWRFPVEGARFRSPVVVGETVYATTESGNLYAIDADSGTEQWRYETTRIGAPEGSPAVADGVIYFQGGDSRLYALTSG